MARWRFGAAACLGIVFVVLVAGAAAAKPPPAPPPTSWTFALYVDGNNNLAKYWAQYSLPFLEAVPANADVHIVALVALENATSTVVEQVSGSATRVLETKPVMDMGVPATLSWWINESTALFPSTYYALDIWDHGYGWKYVAVDDLSGHRLRMPELEAGIAASGKAISVLAFDACNMGNAEVAYQVADTSLVSYLVGSEESVPANGFPYDKMLAPLAANPAMSPRDLSMALVDGWGAYYASLHWANSVNLAAYDLVAMRNGIAAFTTWAGAMQGDLAAYQKTYTSILKAAFAAFGTHYYADLSDYAVHLLAAKGVTDPSLRAATTDLRTWIASFVVKIWNASKMTACGGITLYFGVGNEWTLSSAAYLETGFAGDTGWGGFLTAYNS
jgi:hypothetical protein